MNRITVIGNLVRDPEIRYTTSGTAVVHFTVASDRSKKPGSATDYFECEAWELILPAPSLPSPK